MRSIALPALLLILSWTAVAPAVGETDSDDHGDLAHQTLRRATEFLRKISTNGGYAGIYSKDLTERFGEALYEEAAENEIWVQPPGTPSVGRAFLRAYRATGEDRYLEAAREAGRALAWGQRKKGGWDHRVRVDHLDPEDETPERRGGHCTFDDDITQSALRFLMDLDRELDEPWLTGSIELGLAFLQEAQFDNGAWPQWYPLRGGYHDYYTYNDAAINDCISTLLMAHERYGDSEYLAAAKRGGDFIIASRLDPPQAGWAQQYDHDMRPAKARRFEPAGLCSAVTARNIHTLIDLYLRTGEEKDLEPIPEAIDWLQRSKLENGKWARLYEGGTNKPIYGDRASDQEVLYDYEAVSEQERNSYGWQGGFGIGGAIRRFERVRGGDRERILADRRAEPSKEAYARRADRLESQVEAIADAQDEKGRWVGDDGRLHIRTFVRNINTLSDYLEARGASEG
jgi:hypothetical protein